MANTHSIRTRKVSKSGIVAQIIKATFPEWKGRKITIIEASTAWEHVVYLDDHTEIKRFDLALETVARSLRPSIEVPTVRYKLDSRAPRHVLVILSRFQGEDMGIEIVIPMIDEHDRSVAIDSVAVGDLANAREILIRASYAVHETFDAMSVASLANVQIAAYAAHAREMNKAATTDA